MELYKAEVNGNGQQIKSQHFIFASVSRDDNGRTSVQQVISGVRPDEVYSVAKRLEMLSIEKGAEQVENARDAAGLTVSDLLSMIKALLD